MRVAGATRRTKKRTSFLGRPRFADEGTGCAASSPGGDFATRSAPTKGQPIAHGGLAATAVAAAAATAAAAPQGLDLSACVHIGTAASLPRIRGSGRDTGASTVAAEAAAAPLKAATPFSASRPSQTGRAAAAAAAASRRTRGPPNSPSERQVQGCHGLTAPPCGVPPPRRRAPRPLRWPAPRRTQRWRQARQRRGRPKPPRGTAVVGLPQRARGGSGRRGGGRVW